MKMDVTVKETGEKREIEAIYFSKNKIDFVRTVDPTTGHDSYDYLPTDLTFDLEYEPGIDPEGLYIEGFQESMEGLEL